MGVFIGELTESLAPFLRADPSRIAAAARVPLPARTRAAELAEDAIATFALAVDGLPSRRDRGGPIALDPQRIGASFRSAHLIRIDGSPPDVWDPLSGFFRARDGWVRTHANYPWHGEALARTLGLPAGPDRAAVAAAIAEWSARELEAAAFAAGGLAVAVRAPEEWAAERGAFWPPSPIRIEGSDAGSGWEGGSSAANFVSAAAPLAGLRVLDLTRVIAGPVGTRALAGLGADVLRIDAPSRPEPFWQWLDTGEGKRSTLLDLGTREGARVLDKLLAEAHVVVTGARPGALSRFGLEAEQLAERRPDLVHASVRAWGGGDPVPDPDPAHRSRETAADPWAARRGFDSLVQAATGIAVIEGDGSGTPGALPAQVLDHSAGALLAAGVIALLSAGRGGSVEVSLEGLAGVLLAAPRLDDVEHAGVPDPASLPAPETVAGPFGSLAIARPAFLAEGIAEKGPWSGRAFGADDPAWVPAPTRDG